MIKVLEVNVDDMIISGVYNLVKNVIINKKDGYKIDIACLEPFTDQRNIDMFNSYGTDVYYIGYGGNKIKKQYAYYQNLKDLINKNHYDCVHIHGDVSYKLLATGMAARSVGVKKIILHSHASEVDGAHRRIRRIAHKLLRRRLEKCATDYVSCSDLAAKWMFPGVPPEKVIMINNGVDLDKFRFDASVRDIERKNLGIGSSFLIGHVGRFCYQKNHTFLVEIMKEIKKRGMDAKMIFVGSGPDEEAVKEETRYAGLDDDIIFYGISNRVEALLSAMDMFLLPSNFEGLPIVGVEAQANGLPVVYSDTITHSAQLTDDVSYVGISEDNIQDWIRIIEEHMEHKNIVNRERAYFDLKAKKFSIQDMTDSFFALYENC